MGRGGYLGGGTLIGFGQRWSDSHEFPGTDRLDESRFPSEFKKRQKRAAAARAARKRARKAKNVALSKTAPANSGAVESAPPPIPAERIPLIASVMRDIGRPLPKKAAKRNTALRQLLIERIILPDGKLNTKHPSLQLWLQRMEKTKSD